MSKSIYQFWLTTADKKEKIRIPVLPESLIIEHPSGNETVKIANLGEVTIIQEPGAKIISFSSFFPKNISPLVEYANIPSPENIVKKIEDWKKKKLPIRFLVTGTKINLPVSIENFNQTESGGAVGDINYEITLKEYIYVTPRRIKMSSNKKKAVIAKRPSSISKPKTYTVKKGDTLWAISRKYYGNGADWKKIWQANKAMLIKRDKRNVKQPGHWIYPGQVLKIP